MSQEILITIDARGNVRIEVKGIKGPACKAATTDLERALGTVASERLTAEYSQCHQDQQVRIGGR